jgi:biopolymer transport protein ExbD
MFDKAFQDFDQSISKAELSMTPLIDMVFLLLIFFAATTNFTKETGIQVDKASTTTARILDKELLLISIDKNGNFWYNGTSQNIEVIVTEVVKKSTATPELSIVLIPDKGGVVDPLIQLMDALRAKGITRFSLGTRMVKDTK